MTSGLGRRLIIGAPYLWLIVFFLAPFLIVARLSLSDPATAMPPYRPVIDWGAGLAGLTSALGQLDFEAFATILSDPLYRDAFATSIRIAAIATLILVIIGYPMAYAIAKAPARWRPALLALIILPFWTSFLVRVYALIGILRPDGFLNQIVHGWLGLVPEPLAILNTETAVYVGIVYAYLPFMVLPIYAALSRFDWSLIEAAADLGSAPWKSFWMVTVPLTAQGVFAGCLLVFVPALGEVIIPDLLGGSETLMVGKVIWVEFFGNRDWPLASALAIAMMALLIGPILWRARTLERAT